MEVFQRNISGSGNTISTTKEKKSAEKQEKKPFPEIKIEGGINEKQAESDSMLIHRSLQRKIIFDGLKKRNTFLKIINNEINIKIGATDAVTATRDSLLSFFAKNRK